MTHTFGILLSPFFAIMLYNEEEELEIVDAKEQAKRLAELASSFGNPFTQIQNFMKEWTQ